jgi:hypothetical protein
MTDEKELKGTVDGTEHDQMRLIAGDIEFIRCDGNTGDIYVKEKLVTNDMEVVDAFREWLSRSL